MDIGRSPACTDRHRSQTLAAGLELDSDTCFRGCLRCRAIRRRDNKISDGEAAAFANELMPGDGYGQSAVHPFPQKELGIPQSDFCFTANLFGAVRDIVINSYEDRRNASPAIRSQNTAGHLFTVSFFTASPKPSRVSSNIGNTLLTI